MSETDRPKNIFYEALEINDPGDREAYVSSACDGDDELRIRVQALMDAHGQSDSFMNPPNVLVKDDETSGTIIGRYRLLEKIGEGGFGVVYMVDQLEPVQRRVALKIIKLGMDTNQVIARFEAERQALALMEHPNIAKVFDAGATESGRPYFVMELVHGVPVTEYCDGRNLTTEERLNIFSEICSAIQHAHQKGIIHRDIKPTNILVTSNGDQPVPKVIDFGIAKATQGRLTDKTLFTQFRHFIGTPAYMSPEQAQMSATDVDTRSDVYSLGILLYELLTGKPPFDSRELLNAGYDEISRRIREEEAPPPSKRISSLQQEDLKTVAKNRCVDPAKFAAIIRGDLDWIAMKAVEKDRTRRYATAEALAEDIRRHLNLEPVSAVPPSAWYLLRKFASRHRRLITTASVIAVSLLLGAGISVWQAVRATRATAIAQAETERAVAAEQDASEQREHAVKSEKAALTGELRAQQIAYASDMTGAYQALRLNNLGLARTLVDSNRPTADNRDLRNWEWRALWLQSQGDAIRVIDDQRGFFSSMSLSPNEEWLAVAGDPGGLRIQNVRTGAVVKELGFAAKFVGFTASGRLHAVSHSGVVRSWSVPDFEEIEVDSQHGSHVRDVCISSDGTLLAMFGFDQQVSLWDLSAPALSTKPIRTFHGGTDDRLGDMEGRIAISPDRKLMAIGLFKKTRIVNLETLDEVRVMIPHGAKHALEFSPDGQSLAIGARITDSTVYLYRTADGQLIERFEGHMSFIKDLEFSPDGRLLASASADHTIRIWDLEKREQVEILRGHTDEVGALKFKKSGDYLISGSNKGEIYEWGPHRRSPAGWPMTAPSPVRDASNSTQAWRYGRASFSHDGKYIATRNQDDTVSLRSAKTLESIGPLVELGNRNRGVRFSPVEPLIAAGDANGNVTILKLDRPELMHSVQLVPHAEVSFIRFTRDGKRLLILARAESKSYCIICSIPDGRVIHKWVVPPDDVGAALSPNGDFVATDHEDRVTRIWHVRDLRAPTILRHEGFGGGIAFSPDGKTFVATGRPLELEILNTANFAPISQLMGHMGSVHALAFSPDGSRLATGGPPIKVWDLTTRRELMTLAVDGYYFTHVEFSPDGDAILAISGSGALHLWRVPTMAEIQAFEIQNGRWRTRTP